MKKDLFTNLVGTTSIVIVDSIRNRYNLEKWKYTTEEDVTEMLSHNPVIESINKTFFTSAKNVFEDNGIQLNNYSYIASYKNDEDTVYILLWDNNDMTSSSKEELTNNFKQKYPNGYIREDNANYYIDFGQETGETAYMKAKWSLKEAIEGQLNMKAE